MSDTGKMHPGGMMGRGPGGGPPLGRPVEKPKDFKGTLRRLIKYLKPHRVNLVIVTAAAVISTIFNVASPKISGNAMNKITNGIISKQVVKAMAEVQNSADEGIGKLLSGIEAAQTQAEAAAREQVRARFEAQAGGRPLSPQMQQAMAQAQETAAAAAREQAKAQVLSAAHITEDQLSVLTQIAALPKIGGVADNQKKADTIRKFIELGRKLPADMMGAKSDQTTPQNMSQDEIDRAINTVAETGGKIPFDAVGRVLLWLLAIYLLSSVFAFIMQYVMSSVAQKVVYSMRRQVDEKLARLPLKYFDSHSNGEILSRMTNDIDTIAVTLQQSLTQLITSAIQIVGYVVMMLSISPVLTLIVLLTLPLYVLATAVIAKHSQKYYAAQQKRLGELSGHTEEMFMGHKIVKAYGHEREAIETFEAVNDGLYDAGWKAQFLSGVMFPVMNFISNVGYVLIAVFGGIFVTKNWLNIGDITAFIQYSRFFSMPIVQLANIANVIQSTIACAERVFELLDEEEETPDAEDAVVLEHPRGDIKFDHVSFSYKQTEPLISDMNLDVRKGDTIAIVGPTGAGKTTLVNLLMRFYEIQGGRITFDGVDIRRMKRENLRTLFGMVLQDTWLFNGTIRENIAYGRENATEREIVAAAKAAYADHFIRSLPEGYDTVLNEEASNISQGQRQLLTIARAILANPVVLILDEATSSVDTRTEVLIQKAMSKLMQGRTSFVIAHRLSTIRDANMILVMNKGAIVETGSHRELLEKKGFYADLYYSQFTGANLGGEAV